MFYFRALTTLLLPFILLSPLVAEDVEIVVTATKVPVPEDTLPVGVTVLDSKDWKDKASVAEALASRLSVRQDFLVPGQPSLAALGFGENGFGRISLLVDGFSQANIDQLAPPLNLVPLFALDRIEVLSGPAPTFYGSGSVAGAVNLVTKIPREFQAEASASVDSTLTNRQSLAAAIPVGAGGALISLVRDQELPSRERSDSDNYQAWTQIALPWAWGDVDQQVRAWTSVAQNTLQYPGALLTAGYEADPTKAANPDDSGRMTESKGFASWSATGSNWTVSLPASATYRLTRSQYISQSTFADTDSLWLGISPSGKTSLGRWTEADVNVSVGADFSWAHLGVDRYLDSSFGTPYIEAVIERSTGAGWSRLEATWAERLLASASVRFEASKTAATSQQSPAIDHSKTFLPLSGQMGLTWRSGDGFKTGVEVTRVYRYPFTDEMISYYGDSGYGNSDSFLLSLEPETGYSGAVSANWNVGPWKTAVSGTGLAMENEIVYDNDLFHNVNLGKTDHLVVLGRVEYEAASWASMGGESTLERAVYSDGDNEGKSIPLVPLYRVRGWTTLSWEDYGEFEGSWTVTSEFWKGGDPGNVLNRVPGRQNLDVALTAFVGNSARLRFYGQNLTEDRTPTSVFYSSLSGNTGWYPSEGRVLGVRLTLGY